MLSGLPDDRAGVRLTGLDGLRPLIASPGSIGSLAADVIGRHARPVRAILFDKTATTNWALGWHQDRTICVRARVDVPGFGPWTIKQGLVHVAPPFGVIERMNTTRVHLDDVPETNAPLLVALGSHRAGCVATGAIDGIVRRSVVMPCLAAAGDVWIYSTPILHSSKPAIEPARRRVLQVDYSADTLPANLAWLGV